MKSEQFIKEWLAELKGIDLDSGIENDQITEIEREIETLECVLKDEVEEGQVTIQRGRINV